MNDKSETGGSEVVKASGNDLIMEERWRQKTEEGWTVDHDHEGPCAAQPTDTAVPSVNADWHLHGELYVDAEGRAHFVCHTKDEDFLSTQTAFQQFIALLEDQIANQRNCPFYEAVPAAEGQGRF